MSILRRSTANQIVDVLPAAVVTMIGAGLKVANPALGVVFMASQSLLELAARSLTRVADIAVAESGLTAAKLAVRLSGSDQAIALLARTIQVAGLGGQDERLRVFGQCLDKAATDGARIDEDMLLVAAIGTIKPPHLRCWACWPRNIALMSVTASWGHWSKDAPQTVDSSLMPPLVVTLVGLLIAHGLIAAPCGYGGRCLRSAI